MDTMLSITPEYIGILIWVAWALIGVLAALWAKRFTGSRTFTFDAIIGMVAAVLGGFLSTRFLGDTAVQLFLISLMGAVFFAGAALWITVALTNHFRKN